MPDTAQKTAGQTPEPETAPESRPEATPPKSPPECGTSPASPPDGRPADTDVPEAHGTAGTEGLEADGPQTEGPEAAGPETRSSETDSPETESPATRSSEPDSPKTDSPKTDSPEIGSPAPAPRRTGGPVRRLRAALRRVPVWWPLPLCLALGAGAGVVHSGTASPQYAAVSYVVVSPAGRGSDPAAALGYAQAYGRIATDPMVVALAERRAGLRPGTIADDVRASTSPDAPMVEITATSPSPSHAARNADAVAEALGDTAGFSARRTGARLTVVSKAVAPTKPVSPSSGITAAVGACAGGLLGGLILLVRRRPTANTPDAPAAPPS